YLKNLIKKRGEKDYQKGKKAYEAKKYWEAITLLTRSLRDNPYHTNARFLRGLCHLKRKKYEAAMKDFQFLIGLGLDQSLPYYYVGRIHWEKGFRKQAQKAIQKALALDPKNTSIQKFWEKIK
ncbi:MAG: tetratricopeptide repeat protein, partial [Planctomycetota bacterium]